MRSGSKVTTEELVRDIARRLSIPEEEARRVLDGVCGTLREHLSDGSVVELGDLISLAVRGRPEIREDESGGFSAYAPKARSIAAQPLGDLKSDLDRSKQSSVYYVSREEGTFQELIADHFGRRGWGIVHTRSGMEALSRLDRFPPVACVFESHVEGWQELVRELKCDPHTNWIPVVGIFPAGAEEVPVASLTVQPDDMVSEPFDFSVFVRATGSELAERVTAPTHDVVELELHLPGAERDRREARHLVEEVLFRCGQTEEFCRSAGAALGEALDNALRHGHKNVTCCTIALRMVLDPRRLILAVRDSGKGFDHTAALAAARGRGPRTSTDSDPLARAAAALRSRTGDARKGGIARMLELVDRVEFNGAGNEVVLTKLRPDREADTSTNLGR